MQTTKMINEKPSKLSNLGQEVIGAKRHHFDTYDNPEKRAEKERAKKQKDNRKNLKQDAIRALDDTNFKEILLGYEMSLTLEKIPSYEGKRDGSKESLNDLMVHVKSLRGSDKNFNTYADAFNRLSRKLSKIRYYIRSLDDAKKYLGPKTKESFKEFNGTEKPWALDGDFDQSCVETLKVTCRAIQFGNSLTLKEREYCLKNLHDSIELLNKHFNFNFKDLAFSFGARGKAGSIAHYQDSQKVLAFNRGWIGAFIHELGHAVDYSLGKISYTSMPWDIRKNYREKLDKIPNTSRGERSYYLCEKEIFARLFEVYLRDLIPEMNDFMQVTFSSDVMPDLDEASKQWIENALKPLTNK